MAKNRKRDKRKQGKQQSRETKNPIIAKWLKRLREEAKVRRQFRSASSKIEEIYTGLVSPYSNNTQEDADHQYNILWINCDILRAALYSRNPSPDVRRRYKDSIDRVKIKKAPEMERAMVMKAEQERVENYNHIGKQIAILLERALTYTQDTPRS